MLRYQKQLQLAHCGINFNLVFTQNASSPIKLKHLLQESLSNTVIPLIKIYITRSWEDVGLEQSAVEFQGLDRRRGRLGISPEQRFPENQVTLMKEILSYTQHSILLVEYTMIYLGRLLPITRPGVHSSVCQSGIQFGSRITPHCCKKCNSNTHTCTLTHIYTSVNE
jgi:hypothetical protein